MCLSVMCKSMNLIIWLLRKTLKQYTCYLKVAGAEFDRFYANVLSRIRV